MAMQRPLPFGSMTVLENALLGAMFGVERGVLSEREARRRAAEALAFVGLDERAGQPVSSLNLHQLRFLEMAKALAGQPKLLLLDEVMAGLERGGARALRPGRPKRPRHARNGDPLGRARDERGHTARGTSGRPELRPGAGGGRARSRHARPAGRRRISRKGTHCLRSVGWRPGRRRAGHRRDRRRGSERRGGGDRRLERRGQDDALPCHRRATTADGRSRRSSTGRI